MTMTADEEIAALIDEIKRLQSEEQATKEKLKQNEQSHAARLEKLEKAHLKALDELGRTQANAISQLLQEVAKSKSTPPQPLAAPAPVHRPPHQHRHEHSNRHGQGTDEHRVVYDPRVSGNHQGAQHQNGADSSRQHHDSGRGHEARQSKPRDSKERSKHEHDSHRHSKSSRSKKDKEKEKADALDLRDLAKPTNEKESKALLERVLSLPLFDNKFVVDEAGNILKSSQERWQKWIAIRVTTLGDIFDHEGNVMWSDLYHKYGGGDQMHKDLMVLCTAVPQQYKQAIWDSNPSKLR